MRTNANAGFDSQYFRDEPGVLKMGEKSPKHKRQYLALRIRDLSFASQSIEGHRAQKTESKGMHDQSHGAKTAPCQLWPSKISDFKGIFVGGAGENRTHA
jgi:hypothetical protein